VESVQSVVSSSSSEPAISPKNEPWPVDGLKNQLWLVAEVFEKGNCLPFASVTNS
jgi:hypothetical protein